MTREGISDRQDVEPGTCETCGTMLHIPFGWEPLPLCCGCAHTRIEQLERERDGVRYALQVSDSALRRTARELVEARAELAEARRKALEEAAKVCDEQGREWDSDRQISDKNYAAHCADAIRALSPDRVHPTKPKG